MIDINELRAAVVPFRVHQPGQKTILTVVGFSQNDPLGVGGGPIPNMACVYFKTGGWLLVADLMKHYELVVSETRECKRCNETRDAKLFTETGMVCHLCKEEALFRREERAVLEKLTYYRRKIKVTRQAHVRRVAKILGDKGACT